MERAIAGVPYARHPNGGECMCAVSEALVEETSTLEVGTPEERETDAEGEGERETETQRERETRERERESERVALTNR